MHVCVVMPVAYLKQTSPLYILLSIVMGGDLCAYTTLLTCLQYLLYRPCQHACMHNMQTCVHKKTNVHAQNAILACNTFYVIVTSTATIGYTYTTTKWLNVLQVNPTIRVQNFIKIYKTLAGALTLTCTLCTHHIPYPPLPRKISCMKPQQSVKSLSVQQQTAHYSLFTTGQSQHCA